MRAVIQTIRKYAVSNECVETVMECSSQCWDCGFPKQLGCDFEPMPRLNWDIKLLSFEAKDLIVSQQNNRNEGALAQKSSHFFRTLVTWHTKKRGNCSVVLFFHWYTVGRIAGGVWRSCNGAIIYYSFRRFIHAHFFTLSNLIDLLFRCSNLIVPF